MMEPVKPIIIGGSEQEETHIRWRTPDRSLRLSVEGTTIHSSFGDTRLIENDEYYNLESEEPEYKPYRWIDCAGTRDSGHRHQVEAVQHVLVLGPVRRGVRPFHVRPGRRAGHDAAAVAPADPLSVGSARFPASVFSPRR